ncbi:hypothetical protein [Saccharopolyspora taberi]|uniref:Uncharacterized protein n=1 Tax=Saccharopolyspora taberi TaxID=60895 RepID=A0ABN3VJI2_9PSEU
MRDRFKLQKLLETHWCLPGEQLLFLVGGEHKRGWLGATVAGRRHVPHRVPGPADGVEPPWPVVNPALEAGEFLADEWVHDPAVWGWFHADAPDRAAARCAGALAAGKHFAWLVCSTSRVAVVVEADELAAAKTEPEPASGFGGLLGRAKALTGAKPEDGAPVEPWWEWPTAQVARFSSAGLGRAAVPVQFFRIEFADRSVLEFRIADAPKLVELVHTNLRR